MSKINLEMPITEMISSMSEGNPGAINAMMALVTNSAAIDPQDFAGAFGPLFSLDTYEIYGSSIWILYKDKCGTDVRRMIMLMRATQLGLFNTDKLQTMAADQMGKVNLTEEEFVALDAQVCEQLKEFAKPD